MAARNDGGSASSVVTTIIPPSDTDNKHRDGIYLNLFNVSQQSQLEENEKRPVVFSLKSIKCVKCEPRDCTVGVSISQKSDSFLKRLFTGSHKTVEAHPAEEIMLKHDFNGTLVDWLYDCDSSDNNNIAFNVMSPPDEYEDIQSEYKDYYANGIGAVVMSTVNCELEIKLDVKYE